MRLAAVIAFASPSHSATIEAPLILPHIIGNSGIFVFFFAVAVNVADVHRSQRVVASSWFELGRSVGLSSV